MLNRQKWRVKMKDVALLLMCCTFLFDIHTLPRVRLQPTCCRAQPAHACVCRDVSDALVGCCDTLSRVG